ncbi:response regulator transcription factor [Paracidovorax citrulli]|uniref:response regulator n=1 Tax=Paracidovorax citrulli TaxID=80869 RepID=UPI0005FB0A2C|nr:response regulator transcription factor [Paracidovorax citrulli]QCX11631.1 Transcriptional regulatory protein DegU [Paracidovorax citrulli]UEG45407.1 response regulator transcription factor [Paracidovorax citrulli]UMT87280.1 response regulator transcription factor [Paracidovorax citrulli]UMT95324.1 response regulator transcription factor [Paracidovorax citrulli]WIY33865.1 response regulator transcription factor [Paracidovorax citrulli]
MNADPGQTPIRVLLVDDHPLVRDGVRMRLDATPHIRVAAEAGGVQEALALAEAMAPDIVLTDIRMPDGSGIQLAALFRERFPLVRVMVLSMHQDAEYVRRAVGLGVRGYVLKDAPAGQLVQAIETVRAGGSHFSEAVRALVDGGQPAPPQGRSLTPREAVVLRLLAEGRSNKDIAERMGTSVRTVETHRLHLRRKLRIDGQAALVKYAVAYADLRCDPHLPT